VFWIDFRTIIGRPVSADCRIVGDDGDFRPGIAVFQRTDITFFISTAQKNKSTIETILSKSASASITIMSLQYSGI
jgi:hypothetical protein